MRLAARDEVDVRAPAQCQLGGSVEVLAGVHDLFSQFGANSRDATELSPCGSQDVPGRPESLEQRTADLRSDARDHRQVEKINQSLVGVCFAQVSAPVSGHNSF